MAQNVLKVALAQMDVVAGQPTRNFETMKSMVACAKEAGAHLVVFPEMCIGGYYLSDRWNDDDFVDYLDSFNQLVLGLSEGIGIVFGNVGRAYLPSGHLGDGARCNRYNMAFFAADGRWVPRQGDVPAGRAAKCLQPGYRLLDDERYFTSSLDEAALYPGNSPARQTPAPFLFECEGRTWRIGLQVGECPLPGEDAPDVMRQYGDAGCELVLSIGATPWTLQEGLGIGTCETAGLDEQGAIPPLVRVNAVGMQNTGKHVLALDGGSAVYDCHGARTHACRDDFEQDFLVAEFRDGAPQPAESSTLATRYASVSEKALEAIIGAMRRFDEQVFSFRPKWIIGLSGGIDSSVTASLLALALDDPSRIVGYNLATRYNSDATKANAYGLAQALGIRLVNGSIEEIVSATGAVMETYGYPAESIGGLAQENIQARLRGHMLSTFASVEGGVIMNNGNKVEVALGYATLYGDAIGAIAPIGDITKVRLFELARLINLRFGKEVVPENLIPRETEDGYLWETMPSAELKDAQRDPMKWFYHDWLVCRIMDIPGYGVESLMQRYLEDKLLSSEVAKWIRFYGLDDPAAFIEDLEWVLGQFSKSVFKRIQMPPSISLTCGSSGFDSRESQVAFEQTERYQALKTRILGLS